MKKENVWKNRAVTVILILFLFVYSLTFHSIWGFSVSVVLCLGITAIYKLLGLFADPQNFCKLRYLVISGILAALIAVYNMGWRYSSPSRIQLILFFSYEFLSLTVILLPPVAAVFRHILPETLSMRTVAQNFKLILLPVSLLFFMLYIYLPSENFIGNKSDFEFSYQIFIPWQILYALVGILVISSSASVLKRSWFDLFYAILFGADIAIYAQFMFLNGNLKLIDDSVVDWNAYTLDIVLSTGIWTVLLAFPIIFMHTHRKLWDKVKIYIPAFLEGMLFLTLCIMLLTAPKEIYRISMVRYISAKEQFTVSRHENVILLVWDSVDNAYLKELLKTDPEIFDGLDDFTMYTNTCSVFDSTLPSMTQMLAGMDFAVELPGKEWFRTAWSSERAETFYNRWHEAGYRVNGYNIETGTEDASLFLNKFDNYGNNTGENLSNITLNRRKTARAFRSLSLYRAFPTGLKRYVDLQTINFKDTLIAAGVPVACYQNDMYEQNLTLKPSDGEQNYLIIDHICGTHEAADKIAETKYLLTILDEYLTQLKQLGVYDNASIIITSDHGQHDDKYRPKGQPYIAATPIFLVKQKGMSGTGLQFNSAPIYHEDLQATLLDLAGLYDYAKDSALLGTSIFDIPEDSLRERTWYDRRYDPDYEYTSTSGAAPGQKTKVFNTYYGYTFTGDTETLNKMVETEDHPTVYLMTDYKG